MSFNKVIMEGHLCRDVEIKFAQNTGNPYGRNSIAVNSVSGSAENRREEVCFIDVVFFGRTAEIANEYCHKGSHVLLDGRLQYETWTDQNGQNRSKHSMLVESLQILDTKKSNPAGREQNSSGNLENSQPEFSKNAEYNQSFNPQINTQVVSNPALAEQTKPQISPEVIAGIARNNAMYEKNDGELAF